ncbi:hypothetical protein LSH36_1941g00039 [Paralvinella palmiformis]|uniref:Uncharacterized protein n=1 Tax=Paralvinella palmiformis TaxID=53620 RepID=A0AAD9MQG9_9ANNE|nr:hypothetical protein LSH36_1941g00039 [Paralvinella palmiformis]
MLRNFTPLLRTGYMRSVSVRHLLIRDMLERQTIQLTQLLEVWIPQHLYRTPWWNGSEFLNSSQLFPPVLDIEQPASDDPEVWRLTTFSTRATEEDLASNFLNRLECFSNWNLMRRSVAVCLRFINKLKDKSVKLPKIAMRPAGRLKNALVRFEPIRVQEIKDAEITILALLEKQNFPAKVEALKRLRDQDVTNRTTAKHPNDILRCTSMLYRLYPYISNGNLIRVGGRIKRANLPVILPKQSHITQLVIDHHHVRCAHSGRGTTLNVLRFRGYWIIAGLQPQALLYFRREAFSLPSCPLQLMTMLVANHTLARHMYQVNIALDKPTGQIGTYGGATSDKAVDGLYDVDDGSEYYFTIIELHKVVEYIVKLILSDEEEVIHLTVTLNKEDMYMLQGSRDQGLITLCEVEIDGFIMITSSFTRTPTPTTTSATTSSTTTSTLSTTTTVRTSTTTTTTTNMTDQPKPITSTSTLPWVLFGVSCVIIIIFVTLYLFARKQLSQPSNHSENSTHGQTTLSYINNSSNARIGNQQPINTQNIDADGYEDVNIRNIHLTERQIENMVTEKTPQYERLQGQVKRQGNVEAEIKHLLDLDIIDPVKSPTPWVNPIVVVHKANRNDIRICVDMRRTNEDIMRERHLIPTIDEVLQNMQGSKMFSKPDLIMGYHQLELDPESRIITTFSTHLEEHGFTLIAAKCQYNMNHVVFMGIVLSENGIDPTEERVLDPETQSKVRSFLV